MKRLEHFIIYLNSLESLEEEKMNGNLELIKSSMSVDNWYYIEKLIIILLNWVKV